MKHVTLSTLEKQLINKLQEATDFLKFADGELDSLRQANAKLKAKLSDSPNLPNGFKASPAVSLALSHAKAELSSAQKQLSLEIDSFLNSQLHALADRTSKALQKAEYEKALAGPYSTAVQAINCKKEEVSQTGTIIDTHVNGQVKCLVDWNAKELFTFETLLQADFSLNGQDFIITKSTVSPISAGNYYLFRSNHHSQR